MTVLDLFLAPAPARPEARRLPPSARAAVLGSPEAAVPLAAALALSLRAADRAPAALVATWTPAGTTVRREVASRPAARLAARLAADESLARAHDEPFAGADTRTDGADGGLDGELFAAARGRLAWLALPRDPSAAAEAVRRASTLVEGPFVTALGGARPARLDELVGEHDLAVVAADPASALARTAIAALGGRGVAAVACAPLARGLPRRLALAGLAAPRLDHLLRYGWEAS